MIVKPAADSVLRGFRSRRQGEGSGESGLALRSRGAIIESLLEEVDIYPSLVDLAGFAVPAGLQGESWVPLLEQNGQQKQKEAVFSQYPHHSDANKTEAMGYSMRTHKYRYTEWIKFACPTAKPMSKCAHKADASPHWGDGDSAVVGVELYNHTLDDSTTFGDFDNTNLAYLPENAALVTQLRQQLRSAWPPLEA